jgi:hypothetical protein
MRVQFLEADDVRTRFEAACTRLGESDARRAFSMALNKEGRKSFTQLRRSLTQQSSIPRGAVNAATRFKSATRATMSTVTSGTGRHLPLSFFGAKQFSYGVRAKIWGRAQTFRSAFVVKRYGGGVFKRTGKGRYALAVLTQMIVFPLFGLHASPRALQAQEHRKRAERISNRGHPENRQTPRRYWPLRD